MNHQNISVFAMVNGNSVIARFILLLSALLSFSALAEIIPATSGGSEYRAHCGSTGDDYHPTLDAACAATGGSWSGDRCWGGSEPCHWAQQPVYSCPTGQNWTLSGTSCTRPDCVSNEVRQPNGTCLPPAECPSGEASSGSFAGRAPAVACAPNGCEVSFSGHYPAGKDANGNLYSSGSYNYQGGMQGQCTPDIPSTSTAGTTSTKPPCAAGEGVMTSTSGTVACVPSGTPGSETPKVTKTDSTKMNSDGSSTKTTTTQTCTGAGSCSSTTTTVNTGVGGSTGSGATSGQAGTPGTTTETKDKQGESFCAQNPSLQVCKGGMNEEATQKSMETELKKLSSPTDPSELSADSKSAVDTQLDAKKSTIEQIASDGLSMKGVVFNWQTPELQNACSPWVFNVGGYNQTIDACPTIYKIRDISGYVLYFFTALTLGWILFAGGKQA